MSTQPDYNLEEMREIAKERMSPQQEHLYSSNEAAAALFAIARKHGLNSIEQQPDFLLAVDDAILGLYQQSQLPQLFAFRLQISEEKARAVTADVLDFLAPLSAPTTTVPTPQGTAAANPAAASTSSTSPTPPVTHTMAGDMDAAKSASDVPTYSSTQSALLRETTPAPDATASPRWESDTSA